MFCNLDVWAIKVDQIVLVTPLSLDLTSRMDLGALGRQLGAEEPADLAV